MRICSSHEMRALDLSAEKDYGIGAEILMENAGRAAAQIILEKYPNAGATTEILVFAGKGNNAGDAFVVARRLLCLERRVRVFFLEDPSKYVGATKKGFDILKRMKAKLVHLDTVSEFEDFLRSSTGPWTIVDGILGTGLKGELEGLFFDMVEAINGLRCNQVVALDIPTGVSGDTGKIHGSSILATLTVSFGFPKLGHFLPPGAGRRGDLFNVDISLPPKFRKDGDKFLLLQTPMQMLLVERDRYGHKNAFGHTLMIGGSRGRLGAVAMSASACHKMGTGLVTVATWEDCLDALMTKLPLESMAVPIHLQGPEMEEYRRGLQNYSSVVIGPGLGMRPDGKRLMEQLLAAYQGPLVIDADGLNLIADYGLFDFLMNRKIPPVLTPHMGEMARLLGWNKDKVIEKPLEAVREAVRRTHAVVVLKGAATIIGSTEDKTYLNHYPNDGMATAGSGDVLAGMIGGLVGQKMDPFQAALLGVYLHSLAGQHAAENYGHRSMTAPDIVEGIHYAFKNLKTSAESAENSGRLPIEGRARIL